MQRLIVMAVLALALALGLVTGATALADGPALPTHELFSFGNNQPAFGAFNEPRGVATSSEFVVIADTQNNRILKLNLQGQLIWSIGSHGKGELQFDRPTCVAIDNGNIAVWDKNNARTQVLSAEGKFLHIGPNDGRFSGNCSTSVDSAGNVWFADSQANKLIKKSKDGTTLMSFGTRGNAPGQTSQPRGIALADGLLYLADSGNNRVQVFQNGQFINSFGNAAELTTPFAVALSNQYVGVIDFWDSRLQLYNRQFSLLKTIGAGTLHNPLSVTFGLNGQELYVGDSNHHILVFNLEGQLLRTLGSYSEDPQVPGLFHPYGLSWGPDGMLLVANKFNGTVVGMDPQTGQIQRLLAKNILASGVAVDHGTLYIVGGNKLSAFDYASGNLLSSWTVSGRNPNLHGVVVNNGRLIVSDSNGNRLVVFGTQPLSEWRHEYFMNRWLQGTGIVWDNSKGALGGLTEVSSRHEVDMQLRGGVYEVSCPIRRATGGCRVWVEGVLVLDSWQNPPVGPVQFDYLRNVSEPNKLARVRVERWSAGNTLFELSIKLAK